MIYVIFIGGLIAYATLQRLWTNWHARNLRRHLEEVRALYRL